MVLKKNIKVGNQNNFLIFVIIIFLLTIITYARSANNMIGIKTDIKILDKISSKNELVNLINGEEYIYKD